MSTQNHNSSTSKHSSQSRSSASRGRSSKRARARRHNRQHRRASTSNKNLQSHARPSCYAFINNGTCPYGDNCKYSHQRQPSGTSQSHPSPSSQLSTQPQASQEVIDFADRIERALRRKRFTFQFDDAADRHLWMRTWAAVAVGARVSMALPLLRAYMRLPASITLTPPANDVLHTLIRIVNHSVRTAANQSKATVVDTLQLVADAIEHRLLGTEAALSTPLSSECIKSADHLRVSSHAALLTVISDPIHAERASRLLCRYLDLLQRYQREVERVARNTQETSDQSPTDDYSWAGWRNATVDWLQRASWLHVPQLQSQYEDVLSYTDALCKFVTMFTFYWGAGAVFPKCRQRGPDGRNCDQPLCASFSNERRRSCGRQLSNGKLCSAVAKWRCSRRGHDIACDCCLRQLQSAIVGKPGPRASTDIYDAIVERETVRRDGVVYILSQLASRKPPKIEPNWRTTYRLKCSALIGLVRLGASCEPLAPQRRLELAEIVPLNSVRGVAADFEERQRGRLALRLLTRGDLSTLSCDVEALEPGARVAVIDLQVFVPEVLSVLSTVSDPEFPDHLNAIPFSSSLIGVAAPQSAIVDSQTAETAIAEALENTEIELIRRLPKATRTKLCRQLVQLARDSRLDGTQLKAFAAALTSSLHCTQGPPGTGKSYLGVTLIRALDILRKHVVSAGVAVGPIVVLSYKNHALDEILLDVVKTGGVWGLSAGGLIRCGKPEDERLNAYRERHSVAERVAQDVLTNRVSCIRWTRRTLRDWLSLRTTFLTNLEAGDQEHSMRDWNACRGGERRRGLESVTFWVSQALLAHTLVKDFGDDATSEEAYQVLESMSATWGKIEEYEKLARHSVLDKLLTDLGHWVHTGPSRTLFLVEQWLSGAMPPPRCAASAEEGGCIMASSTPGTYCIEFHACRHASGCERRRDEGVPLCLMHCCTYDGHSQERCQYPRLPNSNVCARHACSRCVLLRASRVHSKKPGGRACSNHSCCSQNCAEIRISDELPFCSRHCCRICRVEATKGQVKQVRSVEQFDESPFCKEHKCVIVGCVRYRLREEGISQDFCVAHACVVCEGKRNRISEECPQSRLCSLHRCSHLNEQNRPCRQRREKESLFCKSHTCRICRDESLTLNRNVVDRAPRNVCVLHPLCAFVCLTGDQCNQPTVRKNCHYCERHVNASLRKASSSSDRTVMMQCMGTTTKGKKCKAQVQDLIGSKYYYCAAHIAQMPDSSSSESELETSESELESGLESDDEYALCSQEGCDSHLVDALNIDEGFETGNPAFEATLQIDPQEPTSTSSSSCEDGVRHAKDEIEAGNDSSGVANKNESTAASIVAARPEQSNSFSHLTAPATVQQIERERECEHSDIEIQSNVGVSDSIQQSAESRDTKPDVVALGSTNCNHGDHSSSATESNSNDERLMFGMCPDECDDYNKDGNSSEDEIPDQLQHLRDIVGGESTSGSESDEEPMVAVADEHCAGSFDTAYNEDPKEWAWNQPAQERWCRVAGLLRGVCAALTAIATLADNYVERARRERAEAAAFAFKKARLIGATVVGATRRLQAIRASEPFAMVVEEACEVLEPTLVSVLAVRSLRKLELIGDHRQLPAFVQPCWFSIETTHPTIKVSLFERLVNCDALAENDGDTATCSILDVQRRMRPEICDLTRCEYDDLVKITDDPCTISRRIGGTQGQTSLESERELWSSQGRIVPGVKLQVFFWDLQTEEGRASVGLSRCNNGEANACANLVGWLLHCGVPSTSITVITPYKGQKLTILKALRKIPGSLCSLRERRNEGLGTRTKGIIVSTVDRYQGDENDIIILSLVCTRPGNRFVALRNRFIVAASRARLGFYIIGSSGALTKSLHGGNGPSHWRRLLSDLSQPASVADHDEVGDFSDHISRINHKIPICCPRHRGTVLEVSEEMNFPQRSPENMASFCSEACPFALPWCGHGCRIPCHSPSSVSHTSKCEELVRRPCEDHESVPLRCCDVYKKQGGSTNSLHEALVNYNCEVMVEWRRPECSHVVQVRCHQHNELLAGTLELELCTEVVADYVNPSCGHILVAPECHKRRTWEGTPPRCRKIVFHERPCGCKARMHCHQSVHEASQLIPVPCQEAVSLPRPRCGHLLSSRCQEAVTLQELWLEQQGNAITSHPPQVVHGMAYGPSETDLSTMHSRQLSRRIPQCRIPVSYRLACGHVTAYPCSEAFERAAGIRKEDRCTEDTSFQSPICGHQVSGPCYNKFLCSTLPPSPWAREDAENRDSEICPEESLLETIPPFDRRVKNLGGLCGRSVTIMRKCGHKTSDLPCAQLFSILESNKLPPCIQPMRIQRPCGHSYDTVCHKQGDPPPICKEKVEDTFTYPCGKLDHVMRPGRCSELTELFALRKPLCPFRVSCFRARCKHEVTVPCHLERNAIAVLPGRRPSTEAGSLVVEAGVDYCNGAVGVMDCFDLVVYRRECGHEQSGISCSLAFKWAASPDEAPPCQQQIEVISPLCGHHLMVACYQESQLQGANPWPNTLPQRITHRFDGRAMTCPVIVEGQETPLRPTAELVNLLRCASTTRLQRTCGHEEDIPCEKLFDIMNSPCERLEKVKCGDCGHETEVHCFELKRTVVPRICHCMVEKKCSVCGINVTKTECFKKVVCCEREVTAILPCGHFMTWKCGEENPILAPEKKPCFACVTEQWRQAEDDAQKFYSEQAQMIDSALEKNDTDLGHTPRFDFYSLFAALRDRAMAVLSSSCVSACVELDAPAFGDLLSAYIDILGCNTDLHSAAANNESKDGLELRSPPDISDAYGSYDLVYRVIQPGDTPSKSFKLVDTQYGFGTKAKIFSTESLEVDCETCGQDGSIAICVAGAFRHHALENAPPFIKSPKRKNGERARQIEAKARRLMRECKREGYDHVELPEDICRFARIYWVPGVIVPLVKLNVKLLRRCDICLDDMLPRKGWFCPEDHFLCRECFRGCVKMAREPDNIGRTADSLGNLICPHDGCNAKYEELLLTGQAHDASREEIRELYDELQELKMAAFAKQEVTAALHIQRRQLQAEFERVMQIRDLDERRAETLRLEIIDSILTLRCPIGTCRMAFIDFVGCFALTCSNCHVHFCAWCVSHHNVSDVHNHVMRCPEASGEGLFQSQDIFQEHHRKRRRRLVIQRLQQEHFDVRKRALMTIESELQDLGITIEEKELR